MRKSEYSANQELKASVNDPEPVVFVRKRSWLTVGRLAWIAAALLALGVAQSYGWLVDAAVWLTGVV